MANTDTTRSSDSSVKAQHRHELMTTVSQNTRVAESLAMLFVADELSEHENSRDICDHTFEDKYHYTYSRKQCGYRTPFLDGDSNSTQLLLEGLMRLPQEIRDHIYDLAVLPVLEHIPSSRTLWLSDDELRAANASSPLYQPIPICYMREFVKALHRVAIAQSGVSQAASTCLNDFLTSIVSNRLVMQVRNFDIFPSLGNAKTVSWLHGLKLYLPYLRNLSIEFAHRKPYHGEYNFETGRYARIDPHIEFLKLSKFLGRHLKAIEALRFWFYLTPRQLRRTINKPDEELWLLACKLLANDKAENVTVKLRMEERRSKTTHAMPHYRSAELLYPTTSTGTWVDGRTDSETRGNFMMDEEAVLQRWLTPGRVWELTDDFEDDLNLQGLFPEGDMAP